MIQYNDFIVGEALLAFNDKRVPVMRRKHLFTLLLCLSRTKFFVCLFYLNELAQFKI